MFIESNDVLQILGPRLKQARTEKKYTQEYVAEKVNISADLLRNIENEEILEVFQLCLIYAIF